jgi:hypothetical protein
MHTPLPRVNEAAVAQVEPGKASMPVTQRHLEMNPLKVLRVTMESGRRALKKSLIMANVQEVSCFQEGADDGHCADGCVLSPGSEANGRTDASGSVCLGKRCWH